MIRRLRESGVHRILAIGLAALTSAAPVEAVERVEPLLPVEAKVATGERVLDLQTAVAGLEDPVLPQAADPTETYESIGQGEASYYGNELAGNRTANGERFNPHALTAAHRSLPMGTKLRVTNLANGRSVIVRINDRGPFVRSRIIDVSLGAAREINMVRSGKAQVKLEILRSIS
jgi:rare lipoprotein A